MGRSWGWRAPAFVAACVALVATASTAGACEPGATLRGPDANTTAAANAAAAGDEAVPSARCGPGSHPETGVQGEVPRADRQSGRVLQAYTCNVEELGHFWGQGTSYVNQSYGSCAYLATRAGDTASPGVQVVDVSDVRHPVLASTLRTPAMLAAWESLKVNERRGLLAAVTALGPAGNGAVFFDVYDIATDCRHPRLLDSVSGQQLSIPSNAAGHEGNWSADGNTYWSDGIGAMTAIDVTDPTAPHVLYVGSPSPSGHGFGISADGDRLYLAQSGNLTQSLAGAADPTGQNPNGLIVLDASDIQQRRPNPQLRRVSSLFWADGGTAQMAVPVTYLGHPYVVFTDELLYGGGRIIDLGDEHHPRIVSKLKLAIQLPAYADARAADTQASGIFGYNAHYCAVDRPTDPTAAACGYFESGIRVFDIRDPAHPREIAYFHPPAQLGHNAQLDGSEHAAGTGANNQLTADWCSSPPRFVGSQLWVACQDYGFMTLQLARSTYPLPPLRGTTGSMLLVAPQLPLALVAVLAGTAADVRRRRRPRGDRRHRTRSYQPAC